MKNRIEIVRSRLLVLVPDEELDEAKYAQKARSLAELLNVNIAFLGKIHSQDTEPLLRRTLVTLSGIASTSSMKSEFFEYANPTWMEIVTQEFNPGDYILCPKEMVDFISDINQSESLKSRFETRMLFVPGMVASQRNQRLEEFFIQTRNWMGILIIIGAAFGLEVSFDSQTVGWIRILGEVFLVSVELIILWFWNAYINRLIYKI